MLRNHVLAEKGAWQSGHDRHYCRKLMPQDHALSVKGTWQSDHGQHCYGKIISWLHAQTEKDMGTLSWSALLQEAHAKKTRTP